MSTFPSSPTAISANPITQRPEREQLATAAKRFEAIFVRQMLAAARKTQFGEAPIGGQAMDTFRQMQDERFADLAAERGAFGLAKMIEAQLARQTPPRNGEGDHAERSGGGVESSQQALHLTRGLDPSVRSFGPAASPFRGSLESQVEET